MRPLLQPSLFSLGYVISLLFVSPFVTFPLPSCLERLCSFETDICSRKCACALQIFSQIYTANHRSASAQLHTRITSLLDASCCGFGSLRESQPLLGAALQVRSHSVPNPSNLPWSACLLHHHTCFPFCDASAQPVFSQLPASFQLNLPAQAVPICSL